MTKDKLDFDASDSIKGIIFQFYVALEKCFELEEGEVLYIEKDGDVSTASQQIEVKKYADELTDSHLNFWKTMNNWSKPNFDPSKYKALVLLTTQDYGEKTAFKDWNTNDDSARLASLKLILTSAQQRYKKAKEKAKGAKIPAKSESLKHMETVLGDENKSRLDAILNKVFIADNSPAPEELHNKIRMRYFKAIPKDNKEAAMKAALGFLTSTEVVENGFEVTEETFEKEIQLITSQYHLATIIFPKKYVNLKLSEEELEQHKESNFVKKIKDIEYDDVINDAITDYTIASRTIADELKGRIIGKTIYEAYEAELMKQVGPRYRTACRASTPETLISKSKDHYDDVIALPSPQLDNFNDTHISFKNGTLHGLADDESKGLVWKLKGENE